ncbi:MAG: SEC-C domain-containing protein [Clostridium sp.]|nr:SEC-C domain-containing protein [Clostridium sp.]
MNYICPCGSGIKYKNRTPGETNSLGDFVV